MSLSFSPPLLSPPSSLSLTPSPSSTSSTAPSSSSTPSLTSSTPSSTSSPTATTPSPSPTTPSSSTSSPTASPASSVTSTSSLTSTSNAVAPPFSSSSSTAFGIPSAADPLSLGSSSVVVLTLSSATPTPTATQSSSPSGFFSNTGAVAGTFTVVGLVGIASVIAVVLFIAKRRHSRSYEDDTEFFDKHPDVSPDPPVTQVTSFDDGFSSDQGHYTAPPMAIANPPTAYYPDHAYAFHPQAFPAESYPTQPSHGHPVAYPQDSVAQRIYSPNDYDIVYPPTAPRIGTNLPTRAEPDSAPASHTQTGPPLVLRPSVKLSPAARANSRMSVDSFYAGIATDTAPSHGQAL